MIGHEAVRGPRHTRRGEREPFDYESGGGERRPEFRLSEFLDSICYPTGCALSINFKKRGKDFDKSLLEELAEFYRILVYVLSGDEGSAESFLRLLAECLTERGRVYIDPVEFAESVKKSDKEKVRRIIKTLLKMDIHTHG